MFDIVLSSLVQANVQGGLQSAEQFMLPKVAPVVKVYLVALGLRLIARGPSVNKYR